ncbi:MAG: putative Glycosyl transferase, family 2 [Rhodocyclaceae bacterium]|nr:putative Glycosyl transferase, family 2 [Rhodocyclaceae bacterium]
MTAPLVSVVMAVHNGERHLGAALASIRAQTCADLEILVIDDGSSDATGQLLDQCPDLRLRVIRNSERLGLARSLNSGLDCARGRYIARMDADDICHLRRFEEQVRFMESRPEVGVLGAACRLIDDDGKFLGIARHPGSDAAMRWRLLFGPPLAHPSAMMRAEVLHRHGLRYDPAWPVAQDYEFWPRLLRHCRGANLAEPLLDYRLHGQSASAARRGEQENWAHRVCERESAPFLTPAVPPAVLPHLRRMLAGTAHPDAPPASQLRSQLLLLAESYIRQADLGRQERRCVRAEAVATVLADGAFVRPPNAYSVFLVRQAFGLAPGVAARACGSLLRHYLGRQLKSKP